MCAPAARHSGTSYGLTALRERIAAAAALDKPVRQSAFGARLSEPLHAAQLLQRGQLERHQLRLRQGRRGHCRV